MKTILIADDDQHIRKAYKRLLRSLGEVLEAPTVAAACSFLDYKKIDAVVTDGNLDDGHGDTVVALCKQLSVPVMMVSGEIGNARCEAGVVYRSKPIEPVYFVEHVQRMLGLEGPQQAVRVTVLRRLDDGPPAVVDTVEMTGRVEDVLVNISEVDV
jgi:DNA-binding NtrC family response regulator